jgi:N-carbamoylputrescine amidase
MDGYPNQRVCREVTGASEEWEPQRPAGARRIKVAFVEWPDGLDVEDSGFEAIAEALKSSRPEILITNELPFGRWLPAGSVFDRQAADQWVRAHQRGLAALGELGLEAIISSMPIWDGDRLANEAVVLRRGRLIPMHRKRYLSDEPGWRERSWFRPGTAQNGLFEVCGVKVGILLCTEAMFTEEARALGQLGADLIAVPRATGPSPIWKTACAMAAIASGAYVVSSNRSGGSLYEVAFGGGGLAFTPTGSPAGQTDGTLAPGSIQLDPGRAQRQKGRYPCYVQEPPSR